MMDDRASHIKQLQRPFRVVFEEKQKRNDTRTNLALKKPNQPTNNKKPNQPNKPTRQQDLGFAKKSWLYQQDKKNTLNLRKDFNNNKSIADLE